MEENIIDNENQEGLVVDARVENALSKSSKWAKFLGVCIIVFIAIYGLTMSIAMINGGLLNTGTRGYIPFVFSSLFILLFLVIYLMIFVYLNRFSNRIKSAFSSGKQNEFVEGLLNLNYFFKLVGIVTIIGLAIFVIAFFVS